MTLENIPFLVDGAVFQTNVALLFSQYLIKNTQSAVPLGSLHSSSSADAYQGLESQSKRGSLRHTVTKPVLIKALMKDLRQRQRGVLVSCLISNARRLVRDMRLLKL